MHIFNQFFIPRHYHLIVKSKLRLCRYIQIMKKYAFLLLIFVIGLTSSAVAQQNSATGFYVPSQVLNTVQTKPQTLNRSQVNYPVQKTGENTNPARQTQPIQQPKPQNQAKSQIYSRKAPVDKILAKQPISPKLLNHYKSNIISSNYLLPDEFKKIIKKEIQQINKENSDISSIKQNWQRQSPVYRLVNYEINRQIDNEHIKSRKAFQAHIDVLSKFLEKAPQNKYISIIEAHDELFWRYMTYKNSPVQIASVSTDARYASVFDHNYKHIFSYRRLRADPNISRRILAANSGNPNTDAQFQKLFDDYKSDLRRIVTSLDITNPTLLRQVGEMKEDYVTLTY